MPSILDRTGTYWDDYQGHYGRTIDSQTEDSFVRDSFLKENGQTDVGQMVVDLLQSMVDSYQGNVQLHESDKQFNKEQATIAFERQKELMQLQRDFDRELRSTQFQDMIADMKKAGINPAVYFSQGHSVNNSQGISTGSVNAASISNPNADTISSLVNSYANVLAAVASNKNADSAVVRSIISAIGSVFSFGVHEVGNIPTKIVKNAIGF